MDRQGGKQSGLTLVELMVAVAIAIIVATLSTPMINVFKNNRSTAAVHDFITTLNFARSEAVTRGEFISICRSDGQAVPECTQQIINGTHTWQNGWIMFVDPDRNGDFESRDQILRIHEPLGNSYSLTTPLRAFITYNPQGFTPNSTGTWVLCDSTGNMSNFSRALDIQQTGRINVLDHNVIVNRGLNC